MIKNVIFDYGNVLVDWNPAYLFLPVFNGDEEKCRFFTDNICNREWFTRMDQDLKQKGYGVFGLTNWPAATFAEARRRFKTIGSIENYVVSSSVHLAKPEPAIYQLLLSKYNLKAQECVFIDDRADNVNAAMALGMSGIVYPGTAKELLPILNNLLGARNI